MVADKKKEAKTVVKASPSLSGGKLERKGGVEKKCSGIKTSEIIKGASADIDSLFAVSDKSKSKIDEIQTAGKRKKIIMGGRSRDELTADDAAVAASKRDNILHGVLKSGIQSRIISPEAPLERIDKESGLPVYKAHLLKVGEGGGTPLCPFDCDCCF